MLGLKKGTISFIERNEEWDTIAQREIEHLKVLFGPVAKDVQQIGSGAISNPSFRVKFMPIWILRLLFHPLMMLLIWNIS